MDVLEVVENNANVYKNRWSNKRPNERRFLTLSAEIGELADAIKGKHEHPIEVELIQIAGICVNWLSSLDVDMELALRIANHEKIDP